jgi:ribosomal protein S18 acetylase RimI-like enzyme
LDYRVENSSTFAAAFLQLAQRIWPRNYDAGKSASALEKTTNIGAWDGDRLVGCVRLLSDGYFFCTIPELMVDPEYRRKGIGRELLRRALDAAPGGTIFLGAQPGNEAFFERAGFRRGPTGYVGRREGSTGMF